MAKDLRSDIIGAHLESRELIELFGLRSTLDHLNLPIKRIVDAQAISPE